MGEPKSSDWCLDRLPLGVWVARVPDGLAVYANETFAEILGATVAGEATIGDTPAVYGIFTRAGRPYPIEKLPFSRVVATGGAVEVDDLVIHRGDGRRVFVRAMAAPTFDRDGQMTHVTVAFIDIGREVEAETARAEMETRLQLAVQHAPIAVFSIDLAGTITLSEGAGLEALGVRSGELVGRSVFEVYGDHPTVPGFIRRGLAGESLCYTVEVGSAIFDSWLTPQRDPAGEVVGIIGLSMDVSELRRLQSVAIHNDRVSAMGTLAASVAHEINNPLTYVLASLDAYDRAPVAGDELTRLLATIRTGVERIASVTSDLRTFSRPDDHRCEPLSLAEVVEAVLRLVRKEAEARASLELILGDTPRVNANQGRMVQVVMNLISNALDAVRDPGTAAWVKLETRTDHGRAVLEVSDNGVGVPCDQRERIFEPFVTTKMVGKGTGLGLFVCRNLVRELGGAIEVCDRPGGGALFRVSLPPSANRTASDGRSSSAAGPPGARVLVIDDEPLIGEAMASLLAHAGFEAEALSDSKAALARLLEPPRYDLVLCDLMMPGLTGMDLAERLGQRAPEVLDRIVFMTGGAFTPRATQFLESARAHWVEKPFEVVSEVERHLSRLLSARRSAPP